MARGKFVIGHKSGGQIELLKETGIVCGDDPNEWRAHINDLMKDRNRRIELGRQAHHATLAYNWAKTAEKIQQAIEEYG
jgi:glycosyltransferase involved in cell wall biosynthesis